MTNTVALVFNGIGSVYSSRPELTGQGPWLKRVLPAVAVAGAVGAALLLSTPAGGFEKLVPVLLAMASLAIMLPRQASAEAKVADHRRYSVGQLLEAAAIFLICIYGGYSARRQACCCSRSCCARDT